MNSLGRTALALSTASMVTWSLAAVPAHAGTSRKSDRVEPAHAFTDITRVKVVSKRGGRTTVTVTLNSPFRATDWTGGGVGAVFDFGNDHLREWAWIRGTRARVNACDRVRSDYFWKSVRCRNTVRMRVNGNVVTLSGRTKQIFPRGASQSTRRVKVRVTAGSVWGQQFLTDAVVFRRHKI